MKNNKILIFVLAFAIVLTFALAKELKEAKIKTSAQCGMCKERIEKHLDKIDAIKYVDLNVETAICTVKYDSTEIDLNDIRKEIASVGYNADDVKASKRAYKKLPKCCKIPDKK